jgi:hypothetical protein
LFWQINGPQGAFVNGHFVFCTCFNSIFIYLYYALPMGRPVTGMPIGQVAGHTIETVIIYR